MPTRTPPHAPDSADSTEKPPANPPAKPRRTTKPKTAKETSAAEPAPAKPAPKKTPAPRKASTRVAKATAPVPGRFITFEGGEGAGKSTQVRRLLARLQAAGIDAVGTREPGGSTGAEIMRHLILSGAAKPLGPLAEATLFAAARADHLDATIGPALARGAWVVCDRFADSTRVYQGALGNVDPRLIAALEQVTVGETRPDLTLILDLPAEEGLARAAARSGQGADRFESEGLAFHRALREAFRALAADEPARCVLIDASGTPEAVEEAIWQAVSTRLKLPAPRRRRRT
ncbi:dTMP kinase [Ancylobacter sp.]|uniref:dTMP kinase n=1 Tax=Ancylobacter sp. TaxID=1872567 RepID=UPI003C7E2F96